MPAINFAQQLGKQLSFIETSAREYDRGYKNEAIRIATALRVIFHQTPRSTSLLTHMNATGIELLSTSDPNPAHSGFCNNVTNVMLNPFNLDMWAEAWLDRARTKKSVLFNDWWSNEIIFSLGKIVVTRRELALWAANKDGGAHVDASPDVDFERVKNGMDFTWTLEWPDGSKHILKCRDLELAALRQFGHDVLNSPELLKLGGRVP